MSRHHNTKDITLSQQMLVRFEATSISSTFCFRVVSGIFTIEEELLYNLVLLGSFFINLVFSVMVLLPWPYPAPFQPGTWESVEAGLSG